MNTLRIVIYARQSLTRDGSESVDLQVSVCTEAAPRFGEVVAVLVEPPSTSGYKHRGKRRKEFKKLLEGFRADTWDAVLAYKTDRLSRGGGPGWAPLLEAIESAGKDLDKAVITPSGFVSEFEIGIRATMDREESKKSSERLTDLAARKAAAGKPNGSRRPYGYEPNQLDIRECEAAPLREAARRIISGHSLKETAMWLNAQGHRTSTGSLFRSASLSNVLTKPRYVGIRDYKGVGYPAAWPAIFDAVTWERLQLAIKLRARDNLPARKYLLTGLMYCGVCGERMTGCVRMSGRQGAKRRTYSCRPDTDTSTEGGGCGTLRCGAEGLEHLVRESVFYRLDTPDLGKLLQSEPDTPELGHLLEQRLLLQSRLNSFTDDYATGLLTRSELARAKTTAGAELRRIEAEIDRLNRQRLNINLSVGVTLREAWDKSESDSWRRSLLSLIIKRIVVNKTTKKPWYDCCGKMVRFDADAIAIDWNC